MLALFCLRVRRGLSPGRTGICLGHGRQGPGAGDPHCGKGGYQWPGGESAPERARGSLWVDIPAPDDKTRAGGMHLRRLDQGKGTKKGNGKVTNAETEP